MKMGEPGVEKDAHNTGKKEKGNSIVGFSFFDPFKTRVLKNIYFFNISRRVLQLSVLRGPSIHILKINHKQPFISSCFS